MPWIWTSPDGQTQVTVSDELSRSEVEPALLDMAVRRRTSSLKRALREIEFHALTGTWINQISDPRG